MSEKVTSKIYTTRFEPKSISSFVLPNRIRSIFADENQELNQSYLFYGLPGCGKSSLAKYIGRKNSFLYVNASVNGKIDYLRDYVTEFCENYQIPMDESIRSEKKVVLFDEINGASDSFFEGLKGFIDTYPNITFLATTNHFSKIPDAIKSRFVCIDFTYQNKEEEETAKKFYLARVAKIINVTGGTIDMPCLMKIADKCFPDFRKTLNLLQNLNTSGVKEINDKNLNIFEHRFKDVYDLIINGDPMHPEEIHKILTLDYVNSSYELICSFDEEFIEYLSENYQKLLVNIPTICITVANSLQMLQQSVDSGIVLKYCVFTLMRSIKK